MEIKGVCLTCINGNACGLSQEYPVWQCAEFSCGEPNPVKLKSKRRTKTPTKSNRK